MGKVNKLNSIIKRVNNNVRRRQRVLSKLKSMRNKITKNNSNYSRYKQNKNTKIPKLSKKKRNEICFKITKASRKKQKKTENLLRNQRNKIAKQKEEIRVIINNIKNSLKNDKQNQVNMNVNDPVNEQIATDNEQQQVNMNANDNEQQQVNMNVNDNDDQVIMNVKSTRSLEKKNIKNDCIILNVHGEKIEIPKEYPGDLWVHSNLEFNRDKPIEYFSQEHLQNTFSHYKHICYGKN